MGVYELANLIDELAADVESLEQTMVTIRYDEFKNRVVEEMNALFKEITDEFMVVRIPHLDTYTVMALKYMCVSIMEKMIKETNEIVLRQGPCEAVKHLKEFRQVDMKDIFLSENEICITYGSSMNWNATIIMKILARVVENVGPCRQEDYHNRWKEVDPEVCAINLTPFSNPYRITILKMLNSGSMSFGQISTATGLRTGHLQFHLKTLFDQSFIIKEDSKGVYGISKKGITALNSIADFNRHMKLYQTMQG